MKLFFLMLYLLDWIGLFIKYWLQMFVQDHLPKNLIEIETCGSDHHFSRVCCVIYLNDDPVTAGEVYSHLPLYMDQWLFPGKRENFLLPLKRSQRYSWRRENFPPVNMRKISFYSFYILQCWKDREHRQRSAECSFPLLIYSISPDASRTRTCRSGLDSPAPAGVHSVLGKSARPKPLYIQSSYYLVSFYIPVSNLSPQLECELREGTIRAGPSAGETLRAYLQVLKEEKRYCGTTTRMTREATGETPFSA